MINHGQKIDCRAFVSEQYFRHFSEKTFSAESIVKPDPKPTFLNIKAPKDLMDRLDDYRFVMRKSSRAEAARELLDRASSLLSSTNSTGLDTRIPIWSAPRRARRRI